MHEQPDDQYFSLIDTEHIYQHAPNGYVSILPGGKIIKINNTLLSWLGHSREEVIGKYNFSDLLSKGAKVHYELFFRPLINVNGEVKELNYEVQRKDGSVLPVLINAAAVYGAETALLAININLTDISQRNAYEKELLLAKNQFQVEKEKFELLARMSPEIIWTVNETGNISYINERGRIFFGLKNNEPERGSIFERIHEDDRAMLRKQWQIAAPQAEYSARLRLLDDQNIYRWFDVKVIPTNKPESGVKWFGTCINIEEHMMDMQRKDEFINLASHELKTPVTVLNGYLQLMQLHELPDVVRNYVDKSIDSLKNFQFLISTLLNVSAINSNELQLNLSSFSVNDLLAQIRDRYRISEPGRMIRFLVPDQKMSINADKGRITQVINNLLNNAIKYSPPQKEVIIQATISDQGDRVSVSVEDFGSGIAPDNIKRIFERYFREQNVESIAGLGLGLYITQNILRAHNSDLNVKSEPGKGSAFSFSLDAESKT